MPCPIPLLRSAEASGLADAARRGSLIRIRRGVYTPTERWIALHPWERYLARVHAVAVTDPDAVFCLESAAALLGLPVFGDPRIVHTLVDPAATSRVVGGVRRHTAQRAPALLDLGGTRVTDVAETVVDTARVRQEAIGLAVADAALRDAAVEPGFLHALNEGRLSDRGRRRARWALERADAAAETVLESVSRAAMEWLGFAAPELQVWFTLDGRRDRVDHWWREQRIVGEADGDVKYDGTFGDPLVAMRARRERDARLRTEASAIAHWAWPDVIEFPRLRGILDEAGVPRVAPEDTARLYAMRTALGPAVIRETSSAPRNST